MFLTHDLTNEGRRGRPSHPRERQELRLAILNEREQELGELSVEDDGKGGVNLVAVIEGKTKTVNFPAKAKPRKAARKTTKAAKA